MAGAFGKEAFILSGSLRSRLNRRVRLVLRIVPPLSAPAHVSSEKMAGTSTGLITMWVKVNMVAVLAAQL